MMEIVEPAESGKNRTHPGLNWKVRRMGAV